MSSREKTALQRTNHEEWSKQVERLELDIKKILTNVKRIIIKSIEFAIARNFPA